MIQCLNCPVCATFRRNQLTSAHHVISFYLAEVKRPWLYSAELNGSCSKTNDMYMLQLSACDVSAVFPFVRHHHCFYSVLTCIIIHTSFKDSAVVLEVASMAFRGRTAVPTAILRHIIGGPDYMCLGRKFQTLILVTYISPLLFIFSISWNQTRSHFYCFENTSQFHSHLPITGHPSHCDS